MNKKQLTPQEMEDRRHIHIACAARGWNVAELSRRVGAQRSYVGSVLAGDRALAWEPEIPLGLRIAAALGIDPEKLRRGTMDDLVAGTVEGVLPVKRKRKTADDSLAGASAIDRQSPSVEAPESPVPVQSSSFSSAQQSAEAPFVGPVGEPMVLAPAPTVEPLVEDAAPAAGPRVARGLAALGRSAKPAF